MKVAISTRGKDLESAVHDRFGRCPYYLIVDTSTMAVEVVENVNADLAGSAGIQSASLLASKGVAAVITGNCGPKAMQVFDTASIRVVTGQQGTAAAALKHVMENVPAMPNTPSAMPAAADASSISAVDASRPRMVGAGRGGGGCGRGMGQGWRCRRPSYPPPEAREAPEAAPANRQLALLQEQAAELKRQMDALQARIKDLT